jgi:hypothetical protein
MLGGWTKLVAMSIRFSDGSFLHAPCFNRSADVVQDVMDKHQAEVWVVIVMTHWRKHYPKTAGCALLINYAIYKPLWDSTKGFLSQACAKILYLAPFCTCLRNKSRGWSRAKYN